MGTEDIIKIIIALVAAGILGVFSYQLALRSKFTVVQGILMTCGSFVVMEAIVVSMNSISLGITAAVVWQLITWQVFRWQNATWKALRFFDALLNMVGGVMLSLASWFGPLPKEPFFIGLGVTLIVLGLLLFIVLFIDTTRMAETLYKSNKK